MITKERLEELIEQGATIWHRQGNELMPYTLDENKEYKNSYYTVDDDCLCFMKKLNEDVDDCDYAWLLEYLFETEEDAEWHKEFGYIERTERLELPTWEEFEKSSKLIRFISKKGNKCKIEGYYDDRINSGFIDVVCNGESQLMLSDYSKENYTLACRKAKELFLGENK